MKRNLLILLAALATIVLSPVAARASDSDGNEIVRPVLSSYTIDIGSAHIADTYLSPLRHSGWALGINYERMQAMRFDPERWVMQLQGRAAIERTLNIPARNSLMWDIDFRIGWGMMRRFRVAEGWSLYAGGSTDLNAGAIYKPRNSNNPVAAKASWTVNALGAVAFNTRILRVPVCFRYQAELPLTGIFFSPDYGELYYEIYLGNHSGLVHAAWPGNFIRLNNLLTADLRFGGTTLRVGYANTVFSTKISDIVTRRISHRFVVGIATEWLSLSATKHLPEKARIISALY